MRGEQLCPAIGPTRSLSQIKVSVASPADRERIYQLRHEVFAKELGQHPDGVNPVEMHKNHHPRNKSSAHQNNDWTLRKALNTMRFWALIIFPFLGFMGIFIILVHNIGFLVDQGVTKMTAAFILRSLGFFHLFSEFSGGGFPTVSAAN